ncbi:cell division protein FtsA [Cytobacillus sp. IB215665]|uniref:cell division protein FtsA n=1 Tax=Cytobacillus sp. IB215665 TaxID=3097357 RepID=UPI002A0AB7F3|nr:cell division FtsA domain-containing protein [Cytobacillus sp. IB215665]MDX8367493.1 cell division FtsA domain-containing protein [Cytobacillus sp. IB215665]
MTLLPTIFALDIGTRSVNGIIVKENDNNFEIVDIVTKEHSERAMLDGQIHDVLAVSKVITEIKTELESRHGKLDKVCVAAAGRALKTERGLVTMPISGKPIMTKQDVLHFELSAVQQAQKNLASNNKEDKSYHYYCVGYSVICYKLDDEEIGNLIDQQGETASVEIIATFLPRVVVESLISALQRSNLEMEALTLEPIAAINVLIPQTMRRLNVALVDIGAGTSDIAITDAGTVVSYGMVPIAGDEITEAISDGYLLDFPLAEKAKRELYKQGTITITDILGFETEVPKHEVVKQISSSIDKLASSIVSEILTLNQHKPPKAVMLVGGGSLTPELPKRIASYLELPENRVAIRGIDAIQRLILSANIQKGPELVTPIGIGIAAKQTPVQYLSVKVNDKSIRLFDIKKLTVGDCLLSAGIEMNKLYGKPGMAIIITLNGQKVTLPGNYGLPPKLLKNNEPCSLDDLIQQGDHIAIEKGRDGSPARVQIKDIIDQIPTAHITINGQKHNIVAKFFKNKQEVTADSFVIDHDNIHCEFPSTIKGLLNFIQNENIHSELLTYSLVINKQEMKIPSMSGYITRNGVKVPPTSSFANNDNIVINFSKSTLTVKDLAELKGIMLSQTIPIQFNHKQILLTKSINEIFKNGTKLNEADILYSGDHIEIVSKPVEPFIFQDIFSHIEFNLPDNAHGGYALLRNNEEVSFKDIIEPGDELRIVFQDKNSYV